MYSTIMAEEISIPRTASEHSSPSQAEEYEKALAHLEQLQDQVSFPFSKLSHLASALTEPPDRRIETNHSVTNLSASQVSRQQNANLRGREDRRYAV